MFPGARRGGKQPIVAEQATADQIMPIMIRCSDSDVFIEKFKVAGLFLNEVL
ncbi:MAG: hypothetical protein ACYC59_11495 [Anaerolineaceae bacterium]